MRVGAPAATACISAVRVPTAAARPDLVNAGTQRPGDRSSIWRRHYVVVVSSGAAVFSKLEAQFTR
jgi:hypothetical protein